jgi:hypothetical protein
LLIELAMYLMFLLGKHWTNSGKYGTVSVTLEAIYSMLVFSESYVFWNITSRIPLGFNRYSTVTCYLHLQSRRITEA